MFFGPSAMAASLCGFILYFYNVNKENYALKWFRILYILYTLMQLDSAIKNLVAYSLQQTLELAWHREIHQPSLLDIVQVVIQHLHSSLPLDVGQLELWLLQGIQRFFGFAKCQIRMY